MSDYITDKPMYLASEAAANARIAELEAQIAKISPLERLETWRMRRRNRRWEISRTTNTATVTLFFGGIAYTCMQPTLDAAINAALATVQGVDHDPAPN